MSRIEEIREKTRNTRKIKELSSGEITQSILDKEFLLSEYDRLSAELEKAWKQVHEEIALEIEQVKRIELLEAELSGYREGMKGTYGIL